MPYGLRRCPADRRIPDASFPIRSRRPDMAASRGLAQVPPLQFPAASPKVTGTQKVGLTGVTVRYSRPAG
jgi:hypothetical protein